MKKKVIITIVVIVVLVILAFFVYNSLTGQVSGGDPYGCSDTDDGQNFFTKGTANYANVNTPMTDKCLQSERMLKEYYCDKNDDQIRSWERQCRNGCSDGACLPE